MKVARFVSIAAAERQRLAPPHWLLGFGLMAGLSLLLVFPQSLESRLASSVRVDPVSLAYLGAWLRAKPDDYPLRLVLAREEMQKGDLQKAVATLGPVLSGVADADSRLQARELMLALRQRQLWQFRDGTPQYAWARGAYLQQLADLSADTSWTIPRLQQFADSAFALGDSSLGRRLYLRLITSDPRSLARYDRLEQLDLGEGNYREAASLCFRALPYTHDINQRRQYFLAGLKVLSSGRLLNEAVAAGLNYVGPLENDSQTLTYLVHLALADQRLDVAARLTSRLLQQHVEFGEGVG